MTGRAHRALAAARRLGWRDGLFLTRVGLVVATSQVLLQGAPMPFVTRAVSRRGRVRGPVPGEGRLVALTDRLLALDVGPLRPNCVLRSLVLLRYLPGDEGSLRFKVGVRPEVRPVDGHAWLERDGEPVAEKVDPREHYLETWSWAR